MEENPPTTDKESQKKKTQKKKSTDKPSQKKKSTDKPSEKENSQQNDQLSESEYEESESEFDGPEEYRDDDLDKQPVYPRGTPIHMQKRWWTDYTNEEGGKVGKWLSDHDLKKKRKLER